MTEHLDAPLVSALERTASEPPPPIWPSSTRRAEPELAALWRELVAGTKRIDATFHTEDHFFMAVEERAPGSRPSLDRFAILERVLLGESQKSIALELGVAISTVSLACHSCLHAIGARCPGARAPMILVMAAHATRGYGCGRLLRHRDPGGRTVLGVARPDRELDTRLSGAEAQITRLLVEGYSYTQIARLRHTSQRTVANQVSAIFGKLEVSGRAALLALLVREGPDRRRSAPGDVLAS